MEYCKTYKTYTADSEIIKKKVKRLKLSGCSCRSFRISTEILQKQNVLKKQKLLKKLQKLTKNEFLYVSFDNIRLKKNCLCFSL